jgi:lipopolysaccharide export system permease protein
MVNEVVHGQVFLRAGRIDQSSNRLKDVVIYDLANEARKRTIYADSGFMRMSADRTDLYLTLFDGYVHDYDRNQIGVFRRVFFLTDMVRVRNVSNTLERTEENTFRGDREMTVCEMESVVRNDQRALALMRRERRAAIENDARALLDAPRYDPLPDTLVRATRRSLTAAYCAALARLGGLLRPDSAEAQGVPMQPDPARPVQRRSPRGQLRPAPPRRPDYGVTAGDAPAAVQRPAFDPARAREAADQGGDRLKGQLTVLASRHRSARLHAAIYQVEIHKKFSIAASCIVFVLIGAPVALRFPRGGVGLVIGSSVVIFGFYYIGLIGGETLADQLIIPPFWAMWTPNLLMAAAGVVLFRRLGYERATGRGGGIADWFARRRRARRAARAAARSRGLPLPL